MRREDAHAHFGPLLGGFAPLSERAAEAKVGPVPEGYLEASAPGPTPDIPPRTAERLADLKRETVKTAKAIGLLAQSKPVDFAWACRALHVIAQVAGFPEGVDLLTETDEAKLVAIHNKATDRLRKLREDAANPEGRGGPPFRRSP